MPMQNTAAMLAFYRGLGLDVTETPRACSVHIGSQMINFIARRPGRTGVHAASSRYHATIR